MRTKYVDQSLQQYRAEAPTIMRVIVTLAMFPMIVVSGARQLISNAGEDITIHFSGAPPAMEA